LGERTLRKADPLSSPDSDVATRHGHGSGERFHRTAEVGGHLCRPPRPPPLLRAGSAIAGCSGPCPAGF